MVCQSRVKIMSAASPVFRKVVHLVVPVTFKYVQIVFTTGDGDELCGVRFPNYLRHTDGCIGLRYARASGSRNTSGYYEAVSCGACRAAARSN